MPLVPRLGETEVQVIAESIPHIAFTAMADGRITYLNRRCADYTGVPGEQGHGWRWLRLVHGEDAALVEASWVQATNHGTEYRQDCRLRRRDGAFRWHALGAMPVRDEHDEIYLWVGTATEIEAEKQLQRSLQKTEREAREAALLLHGIEQYAPVGIALVDREFRLRRVNRYLTRFSPLPSDAQIGKTLAEVIPDVWPAIEEAYRTALRGETVSNVAVTAEDPGHQAPGHFLASFYPVSVAGQIVGVGNVVFDVTAQVDAQETLARNLEAMVRTIATTVEYRDPYTAGHQQRVAEIAAAIATELGMTPHDVEGVRTAAAIHDIGKISVPTDILNRPGLLSPPELELIETHAATGAEIVRGIEFPWPLADVILQHHERMDGSGYPSGLVGDEICAGARIVAVADVVDAMSWRRPYRGPLGVERALAEIEDGAGRRYDPEAAAACLRLHRQGRITGADEPA